MASQSNQTQYPEERELAKFAALLCAASGEPIDDMTVATMASKITRILDDESTSVQLLRSVVIRATIKKVDYEQSSHRYVVSFVAANDPDGKVETVRSNRLDGRGGKAARAIWGRDLDGHEVMLYKTNEAVGRDPKNAQGYRVSPWCRDLGPAGADR